MAEGDMLLFPGLKTGYQNSIQYIWLSAENLTHKRKETHSQKTKQSSDLDSDLTQMLELLNRGLKGRQHARSNGQFHQRDGNYKKVKWKH